MSTADINRAVVRRMLEAVGTGDVPAIADCYADDGYCQTMGHTLISGIFPKEQVVMAAQRIMDAFPKGVAFEILNMTAEEDRLAVEAVSHGDHVSGRHYSNHYHFFFQLRDGKVVVMKEFMDTELVTDVICGGQRLAE